MNQNKNNKEFLKCFLVSMIIVTLICLIYVSKTLAQWPSYSNYGWFSQPFLNSPFLSFNPISSYTGSFDSGFSTPYGNYPSPIAYLSPGLLPLELERYNNFSYNDIFSPYSSSGSLTSPLYPEPVPVGQNNGAVYTGSIGYNPYYPGINSSAFIPNTPSPYTMSLAWYSPWLATPSFFPSFLPSSIIRFPNYDDPNAKPISPSPWE